MEEQMEHTQPRLSKIDFIFTETGFRPDISTIEQNDVLSGWMREGGIPALYQAVLEECPKNASLSGRFLYRAGEAFFEKLTDLPELELAREQVVVEPDEEETHKLLAEAPFVIGAEYLNEEWIRTLFQRLQRVFAEEITAYDGTVEMYLTEKKQNLRVPERVFFHLVEHQEEGYPFAFLATYATKNETGAVSHLPLKYALTEYKGKREKLMTLLSCLNKAAEVSPLVAGFMESGELFHPLRLTAEEAYEFLKQIEEIEKTGILCRIPNWWRKKAMSVTSTMVLGEKRPSMLGFDTIVSMQPKLMVDGVELTQSDIKKLLAQTEGLAFLKGKWIEVDHGKLKRLLEEMENGRDITLLDALRLEMGTAKQEADVGTLITNGKWLGSLLRSLRQPEYLKETKIPASVHATLRPYQKSGYSWLDYMGQLGFGACLADDMGLGKTIQVLAYLEKLHQRKKKAKALLVVPASLLGNWQKEAEKFVPSMKLVILHGESRERLEEEAENLDAFLAITTYGMAGKIEKLKEISWDCVILDEAQAIKNPTTAQTRAIKKLSADMRIAMTGTPIENDLTNLWSLFDFLNKGLLGTSGEFREFHKRLKDHPEQYGRLKSMVAPFMLRRVKTDKRIIADLPEKMETLDYVDLSKKQVVLYRKIITDMEERLREADGIERRGLVLAALIKLKQVCNHPDQYLGQTAFSANDSGKFSMLRELCETIYEKRERVLVFTQFREITEPLAAYLQGIFHAKGFVLHGGTPVAKRSQIVEAFQGEAYVPFLVLSVKAGGTGLNLTKANHVIHFDRWWNPAVENQATDRAFRIGQKKNVMVHKLVSRGTIEEKIDALIESKKELADQVIGSGGESWITELDHEKLMELLRLEG